MVIGITGGVGCGKSTVLNLLEEKYGAKIIEADALGHEAMKPGTEPYQKICDTFGVDITGEDGQILRPLLADKIYRDDNGRERLNAIVHPFVIEQICKQLNEWKDEPVVCLETAILFETGCDTLCDIIWAVVTDKELRIQRLMESRGYSREKTESIMRVQLSDKEWEKRCDALLVNNGNLQKLQERIEELLVRKTNL